MVCWHIWLLRCLWLSSLYQLSKALPFVYLSVLLCPCLKSTPRHRYALWPWQVDQSTAYCKQHRVTPGFSLTGRKRLSYQDTLAKDTAFALRFRYLHCHSLERRHSTNASQQRSWTPWNNSLRYPTCRGLLLQCTAGHMFHSRPWRPNLNHGGTKTESLGYRAFCGQV